MRGHKFFLKKCLFIINKIYLFGERAERGRERIPSRLQAQCGTWCGAWFHGLGPWPELKSRVGCLTDWAPQAPLLDTSSLSFGMPVFIYDEYSEYLPTACGLSFHSLNSVFLWAKIFNFEEVQFINLFSFIIFFVCPL